MQPNIEKGFFRTKKKAFSQSNLEFIEETPIGSRKISKKKVIFSPVEKLKIAHDAIINGKNIKDLAKELRVKDS